MTSSTINNEQSILEVRDYNTYVRDYNTYGIITRTYGCKDVIIMFGKVRTYLIREYGNTDCIP